LDTLITLQLSVIRLFLKSELISSQCVLGVC